MKYILILLFFVSAVAKSQSLDTLWVRDITMQAGDWSYLTGKVLTKEADSIMITAIRKIRIVVQAQNPANFNTNVTIDSISGSAMIHWYKILLFSPFIEIKGRGNNIFNAIIGETNLTPFITEIDNSVTDLFIRERTRGKNYLLDTN